MDHREWTGYLDGFCKVCKQHLADVGPECAGEFVGLTPAMKRALEKKTRRDIRGLTSYALANPDVPVHG